MKFVYVVNEYTYKEGAHIQGIFDEFFKAKQYIARNYSDWNVNPNNENYRFNNNNSVRIEQYELE